MTYNLTTNKTWDETLRDLGETFDKWDVRDWTLWPVRPRARANASWVSEEDRTVTVTYKHPSGPEVSHTMKEQRRPQDNLRVLYLAIEAMRMNEKRGLADVMKDAYLQLAAPERQRDPYEILGIRPDTPETVMEASYKALAKVHHPDKGGDPEKFKELNDAYERITKERGNGA